MSVENLRGGDPRQIGGKYTVVGRLGSGVGGDVFLGRSPDGGLVAVMSICPELAGRSRFRADFTRWVEAAPRNSGSFVLPVIDADPQAQPPWLAVRYEDGFLLEAAVEHHGPLPLSSAIALAAGLARELTALHEAGRTRGDLKPADVLLTRDGPRLLAARVSPAAGVPGAADFLSPEQAFHGAVGAASDVFSLGAVLAFAASGERPYGTGSLTDIRGRILNSAPQLDLVPARLRPLIERCMAREPTDRPTAQQFLVELLEENPEAASWPNGRPEDWLRGILPPAERPDGIPSWSGEDLLGANHAPQQGRRQKWGLEEPPWWNWEGKYPPEEKKKIKKGNGRGRIAVSIAATATVTIGATIGLTAAFSNHGSSSTAKSSDHPAAASSVATDHAQVQLTPAGTATALPLSDSRFDWKGLVTYKITSGPSDESWLGTSKAWQDDWILSADCPSGACGATLTGYITADPFKMALSRAGATYYGSVPVNDLWGCQINKRYFNNNSTLIINITATHAKEDPDREWEITTFSGTVTWKVSPNNQGGCSGATYSMQLQSAQQY